MKGSTSKIVVVVMVAVIVGIVLFALGLRTRLRCSGFAGPGLTAEDLPAEGPGPGELRFAHFNIRNFPEMPVDPEAEPVAAPVDARA